MNGTNSTTTLPFTFHVDNVPDPFLTVAALFAIVLLFALSVGSDRVLQRAKSGLMQAEDY